MTEPIGKEKHFINHFGDMGSSWGLSRAFSQILALLIIKDHALNADEIAEMLNISRSNVSGGIKELQNWQLIRTERVANDRKVYYTCVDNFWSMAKSVMRERRRRELDPTLLMLRNHMNEQEAKAESDKSHSRIKELHDLLELFSEAADCLESFTPSEIKSALRMGLNAKKMLRLKNDVLSSKKR